MRFRSGLMAIVLLTLLARSATSAELPLTACSLTGVYVLSAVLAFDTEALVSGQFTFTRPGSCVGPTFGNVQVELSILFAGSPTSIPFSESFSYSVDGPNGITIGPGLIQVSVGGVSGEGIANVLVFVADPGIAPIRLAGTAVRRDLLADVKLDLDGNTAVGGNPLANNTSGIGVQNTAVGATALFANTTGHHNTGVGAGALSFNTIGHDNTIVGANAFQLGTGSNNIAIGSVAGDLLQSGDDNIYIGHEGVMTESATIRLGDPAVQTGRTFIAGISGATSTSGVPVFVNGNGRLGTTTSARRFKEDIRDMEEASTGLLRLRPVTFRYRPEYEDGARLLQYGLIAEEVAEVYPELVVSDSAGRALAVRYHLLPAMLLNELQRQHRINDAQQRQLEAQEKRLAYQATQLADLLARLARLEGRADLAGSR